ncbi:hypothetical protein KR018_001378, partial [Drosophila ironensis]
MMFTNSKNKFQAISVFKNGKYGTVYKGTDLNAKKFIVIKKISLDEKIDMSVLCKEICNTRQFKHPNINPIIDTYMYREYAFLIYPFMCFGDCQMLLQSVYTSGFSEILIALILKDIISALVYIHSQHFVHGSIRAKHILLNSNKAVLSNFSQSETFINQGKIEKCLYGSTLGRENNLNWIAPEVLHQNLFGYTEKIDIYSIGITCCEMTNGFQPFKDTDITFMYTEKIRGNLSLLLDKCRIIDNEGKSSFYSKDVCNNAKQRSVSDDFYQFVEICLNKNPARRWNSIKLMTHSFLKQCRNATISDQLNDI